MSTGYASPAYAESLSAVGARRALSASGGSILERVIPGTPHRDAMGPYPLFACTDWRGLHKDLDSLEGDLVTLVLVADPFGDYAASELKSWFDVVIRFKEHFLSDLSQPLAGFVAAHHRRNAARAARELRLTLCEAPAMLLDEWDTLYRHLVARHRIRGVAAFSRDSFAKQLEVPGLVAFQAARGKELVGMTLWYVQGNVAYYHLGAYSDAGYELRASFGLFWCALERFAAQGLHWANLGGAPATGAAVTDGLTRFKRGWSTGTRPAYLCGRILDRKRYAQISGAPPWLTHDYFPSYRKGEFTNEVTG